MLLSLPLAACIAAAAAPPATPPPVPAAIVEPQSAADQGAAPALEPAGPAPPPMLAALPYLAHVASDDPQFGRAASSAKLARTRGGSDTTVANEMQLSGTVSGNSATNLTTGANIITAGSFANAAGLPTVIQNSGANVLIQNATIINLQVH
jgi:hypothetical protein